MRLKKGLSDEGSGQTFSWQRAVPYFIFTLFVIAFALITISIFSGEETRFDTAAFRLLKTIASDNATALFIRITFFGSTLFFFPTYILIIVLLALNKKFAYSFTIAIVGSGSGILLLAIKSILRRPRPPYPLVPNVEGFSYPSGHSFCSFVFAGVLIYLLSQSSLHAAWKWLGTTILVILAFSIALSRIYLHVHYASDVFAGICLSIIWLCISMFFVQRFINKTS